MGKIKTVLEAIKWKIIPFSLTDRKSVISTIDTVFLMKNLNLNVALYISFNFSKTTLGGCL